MNYQKLVNQTLKMAHADIERGLTKAREQETSINILASKLNRMSWTYHLQMNAQFDVTFIIEPAFIALRHQIDAVRQALSELFTVEETQQILSVYDPDCGFECTVRFGTAYES